MLTCSSCGANLGPEMVSGTGLSPICPTCARAVFLGVPAQARSAPRKGYGMLAGVVVAVVVCGAGAMVLLGVLGLGLAVFLTSHREPVVENSQTAATSSQEIPAAASALNATDAGPAIPAAASAEPFLTYREYGWQPDVKYTYRFRFGAEIDRQSRGFSGSLFYDLNDKASSSLTRQQAAGKTRQRQGVAFVAGPDGVLVTAAHLLRGATRVHVFLAGQEHEARVLAVDQRRQLALLRIGAQGLSPLPLGADKSVTLPQQVRSVNSAAVDGRPENFDLVEASLLGLVSHQTDRLWEVRGKVDPRLGGAPLLSPGGEVLGVTTSLFAPDHESSPGFAVTATAVSHVMREHGLTPAAASGAPLDDEALRRSLARAVALVLVDCREGETVHSLVVGTGYHEENLSTEHWRSVMGMKPGRTSDFDAPLLAGRSGEAIESVSVIEAPFLLPPLPEMPLVPIPTSGGGEVVVRRVVPLREAPPIGPRGNPYPPAAFRRVAFDLAPKPPLVITPEAPPTTIFAALERLTYRVVEETSDTVTLEQTLDLVSLEREGRTPRLKVVGEGTLVWDKRWRVLKSLKQSQTMVVGSGQAKFSIPLEWSLDLRGTQTFAEWYKPDEEDLEDERRVEQALRSIQAAGKEPGQVVGPLQQLRGLFVVNARREQVGEVLEPLLASPDSAVRIAAMQAAERWGTRRNVPALLENLKQRGADDRRAAMTALRKLGGTNEAEAVAKYLADLPDRAAAAAALSEMGPAAEDAAWQFARSEDQLLFNLVWQTLGAVGTHKTLLRSKLLPALGDEYRALLVKRAVDRIEARLASGEQTPKNNFTPYNLGPPPR
jgi:S1-C subfamily serine protease